MNTEERLRHRDRCIELAETAPTEAIRASLLRVARLYETERDLIDRTMNCLVASKQPRRCCDRGNLAVPPPRSPVKIFRLLGHIAPLLHQFQIRRPQSVVRDEQRYSRAKVSPPPTRFRLFAHIGSLGAR
jgi:hypothetical protein